jgi:hypothetical protein
MRGEINERVAEITVQYHESESEFVYECGRSDCMATVLTRREDQVRGCVFKTIR